MLDPHEALHVALSDRYELEGMLAEGGMGIVYVARDLGHDRRVAIKTVRPDRTAAKTRRRFEREISITAELSHPNILPLLDSGVAGETIYYVMPLVEGESLRQRLAHDETLPVREATAIAMDVAEALDYAHRRDVIHRDIKPANVILSDGHASVADFGIATALWDSETTILTTTGHVVGTLAYMAPEQMMGTVTAQCDIYALGCVLYEMLVGEVPLVGSSPALTAGRRLHETPAPVRERRPDVPPHLETAVMRALARDAKDRFVTAGDFAASLN